MNLGPRRCERTMCGKPVMNSDYRYCSEHRTKMTERKFSESFAVGGIPEIHGVEPEPINRSQLDLLLENDVLKQKCRIYRRECRRLNEQVKYVRSLEAEVLVLRALLEREDDENADTDPDQLAPTEDSFPTVVAITSPGPGLKETYNEWDMRTRFGSGGPRT